MYYLMPEVYDWEGTRRFAESAFNKAWQTAGSSEECVVLDLGCGTGNFAKHWTEKSWKVIGFDASPGMVGIAQKNAHDGEEFHQGDIRDLPAAMLEGKTFPVITCVYDVLNHLGTSDDLFAVFSQVKRYLSGNGQFLFDVTTLESFHELWHNTIDYIDLDDSTTIIRSIFDESTGTASASVTSFLRRDSKNVELYERRDERVLQCYFSDDVIHAQLEKAGLKAQSVEPFVPFPDEDDEPSKTWWIVRHA